MLESNVFKRNEEYKLNRLEKCRELEINGITEIIGDSGVGKTHIAIHIKKELKTLYISSKISKKRWFPDNYVIESLNSFLEFKVFVAKELKNTVKEKKIEKIVIDGLEDYLFIIDNPRKHSNEIFRIIKVLKYLYFMKKIFIIIINSSNRKWMIDDVEIVNNYFGLPWEYMINTRYLVTKIADQRWVSLVSGRKDVHRRFYIDDDGIKFY